MLFWTLKIVIISVIVIAITHNLYIYFKNILTKPKIKDFIDSPNKQYDEILNILQNNQNNQNNQTSMKSELQNFLNDLQHKSS
jgi:hypothetical protein